jgi:hypothetical protein
MQRMSHAVFVLLERSSFASVFVGGSIPSISRSSRSWWRSMSVIDTRLHRGRRLGRDVVGTALAMGRSCSGDWCGQRLRQRTSGGWLGAPPIATPESARCHRGTYARMERALAPNASRRHRR